MARTVMVIMFSWRNFRNFSKNRTLVGLEFYEERKELIRQQSVLKDKQGWIVKKLWFYIHPDSLTTQNVNYISPS